MLRLTKRFTIQAPVTEVWDALTNPDTMAQWMADDVVMNAWPDGSFSWYGGSVLGYNREVQPPDRLVQDWKEDGWSHYSRVVWQLGETGGATQVEFVHDQIPVVSFQGIDKGWEQYFIGPLKRWMEG